MTINTTLPPSTTTLKAFFNDPGFSQYLKSKFPLDIVRGMFEGRERIVQMKSSASEIPFSEAWSGYYSSKPVRCGKVHEYTKGLSPHTCPHRGNPVCGHLEDTHVASTVCIASYVARVLSGADINPRKLIIPPEKLDYRVASSRELFSISLIRRPLIRIVQECEDQIWADIRKHRDRLHTILTESGYLYPKIPSSTTTL